MSKFLGFLLTCLLINTLIVSAEIPEPLRVALMTDLYPMSFLNEQGDPDGVFPLAIQEIATKNNITIVWVEGTWNESLDRAADGSIHLMTSLIYTEERDSFLDYGKEAVFSSWSQVFQTKVRTIEDIFDLEGMRIGLMEGDQNAGAFVTLAEEFGIQYEPVSYTSFVEIHDGLDRGEVDAGIFYNLFHLSAPKLLPTGVIFQPTSSLFAVPEGQDPEILELIDQTLLEWKEDRNSYYYKEVISLLSSDTVSVPRWLVYSVIGLLGLALTAIVFVMMLRQQVRFRTSELSTAQNAYRSTFMNAIYGIAHGSTSGELLRVNPELCDFLEYEENELVGLNFSEITHPEDLEADTRLFQSLVSGDRESYRMVKRYITKEGNLVWGKISVSGVRDEHQELMYVVALIEDINHEKQVELKLGDLESRYSSLFQNSYQMTAVLDEVGRLLDANDTLRTAFQLAPDLDDLSGKTMEDMEWMGTVVSLRMQEMVDECLSTGRIIRQTLSAQESGTEMALDITIKPVVDSIGNIRYCIVEAHDITTLMKSAESLERQVEQRTQEIKKAQDQLIEAEKMASLGRLVAGVAHEINTPVGVAKTGVSYLSEQVSGLRQSFKDDELTEDGFLATMDSIEDLAKILDDNLEKAVSLIHNFQLTSADQSSDEIRKVNVREYFSAVLHTVMPRLKKAGIVWNIDAPDEEMDLNVGAINPILVNLTINSISHAFEASPGVIDITYRSINSRRILTFSDDGSGIEADLIPSLFEPFFTTGRGRGFTGLGLNIIYNLVKDILHGEITCESRVGTGTTFRIEYPDP